MATVPEITERFKQATATIPDITDCFIPVIQIRSSIDRLDKFESVIRNTPSELVSKVANSFMDHLAPGLAKLLDSPMLPDKDRQELSEYIKYLKQDIKEESAEDIALSIGSLQEFLSEGLPAWLVKCACFPKYKVINALKIAAPAQWGMIITALNKIDFLTDEERDMLLPQVL